MVWPPVCHRRRDRTRLNTPTMTHAGLLSTVEGCVCKRYVSRDSKRPRHLIGSGQRWPFARNAQHRAGRVRHVPMTATCLNSSEDLGGPACTSGGHQPRSASSMMACLVACERRGHASTRRASASSGPCGACWSACALELACFQGESAKYRQTVDLGVGGSSPLSHPPLRWPWSSRFAAVASSSHY